MIARIKAWAWEASSRVIRSLARGQGLQLDTALGEYRCVRCGAVVDSAYTWHTHVCPGKELSQPCE